MNPSVQHAAAFSDPRSPIQSSTAAKHKLEDGTALVELGHSIGYCCPHCGGEVVRVRRRLIDRLWLVPVNRFRCTTIACGHEYTLRGADA